MNRFFISVSVVAIVTAGAALFQLKHHVSERAKDVRALQVQLSKDREAIRVLKAEWSHLNSPAYLQDLSKRYLALKSPSHNQIRTSPEAIPFRPQDAGPVGAPNELVTPEPKEKPSLDDSGEVSGV